MESSTSRYGFLSDEDGILVAGLAKEAAMLFQSRRFTDCIDVLNRLLQKKQDDPKVLHNIAVAEYFRDGSSDPKKLLEGLNKVKIVTDQASNYKLAGKWIMEESKIYWTPCAAHCVNLMLSDVSDLPLVHDLVEEAKCVTIFIYNHTKVLHLMRNHTDGRDIVRPSVTRFATSFLCLQSIFEQKQRLRNMIASPEWMGSKWAKTPTGKDVRRSIKRSTFWNHMHYALKIMAPLVDVVRLVDTEEKPSMGYIYKAMEICKEKVKKNLGEENEEDKEMWKVVEAIIDDRWKAQLNQPLHAAAYYLNPMFYYATPTSPEEMESNGPVKEGLLECITKLTGDLVEEKKIIVQLVAWRTRRGRLGKPNAVACVNDMAPVEWWVTFGSEIPELQRFAKRVLGLTTSASPCERNWSTFSNKRSEDLARVTREQVEDGGNGAILGSKGSNTTPYQFFDLNGPGIVFADEFDTSVATLNIAVVLYHLHEYAKALSLLEPVYQNIEPIDEITALKICLLFLDVALATDDVVRAANAIQYLERAIGVGYVTTQGENLSDTSVKASHAPSKSSGHNTPNLGLTATANPSENLTRALSDDALAYEKFLSTLDSGGQNLARPIGLSSSNVISRISGRPGPVDLKLKLHLYKVRFLILTKNLKAAKREVKLAMNIARDMDSSTALLLKSQLEYSRGNHSKAVKLLMAAISRTEGVPALFNNNFGCIFHQLRKHHISNVLFSKALRSSSLFRLERPLKISYFSQDKSLFILYNCGLQYLACGKPLVAAHCFLKASSVFYNRPLLWLRIAECCLLAQEKGLLRSSGALTDQEVRLRVVGKGKWRQVVVKDGYTRNGNSEQVEQDYRSFDCDRETKLSLSFARQCLFNALHMLNDFESKSLKGGLPFEEGDCNHLVSVKSLNHKKVFTGNSRADNAAGSTQASSTGDLKDPKGGVGSNTTIESSISAYRSICRRENHVIKQAVLADLCYLELSLENPLKAFLTATSLLTLPDCSKEYTFLGHLYAAEALCILNRPKEAAEHLSVYMVGDNVELPFSKKDMDMTEVFEGSTSLSGEECQDTSLVPTEARGTLYVNLATMSALQGDFEQADRFAKEALLLIPKSRQAVLTSLYIDLLLGNSKDALIKLKRCSSIRFLAAGVKSNGSS